MTRMTSVVDRDIDVEGTAGLTRRDMQVNAPDCTDREARQERNAIGPARTDKRRAGHDLELRHGGEQLDLVAGIRAYTVRMQLLKPEDIGVDLA